MTAMKCDRILVPTDLSPLAGQAVSYAHSLAETFNAELHVLHVVKDASELAILHGPTGVLEPGDPTSHHDRWLASILGSQGTVRRVEAVRLGTDVADRIIEYAQKHGIDLIVMGTHGKTGLLQLLVGSVAEAMLRKAPCPLLVLRPSPAAT